MVICSLIYTERLSRGPKGREHLDQRTKCLGSGNNTSLLRPGAACAVRAVGTPALTQCVVPAPGEARERTRTFLPANNQGAVKSEEGRAPSTWLGRLSLGAAGAGCVEQTQSFALGVDGYLAK